MKSVFTALIIAGLFVSSPASAQHEGHGHDLPADSTEDVHHGPAESPENVHHGPAESPENVHQVHANEHMTAPSVVLPAVPMQRATTGSSTCPTG